MGYVDYALRTGRNLTLFSWKCDGFSTAVRALNDRVFFVSGKVAQFPGPAGNRDQYRSSWMKPNVISKNSQYFEERTRKLCKENGDVYLEPAKSSRGKRTRQAYRTIQIGSRTTRNSNDDSAMNFYLWFAKFSTRYCYNAYNRLMIYRYWSTEP